MSVRAISDVLQKKAEEELNEIPSRIPEDIAHIRTWLSQQPHLHKIKPDDQEILNFLRGCKFSLQKTKEKLDMIYTMKSLLPEFYSNRNPLQPQIQEILQSGFFLPLSKIEEEGPRFVLIRTESVDPEKISFVNSLKTALMIIDILLHEDDNFVISGQHGFINLKGMSVGHLVHLNVDACKKAAICLEHAYPTRPKGFYFINAPSFIESFLNIVTPFVSEKLRKRVHVFSENSLNNIYKIIPSSLLPKEYGGSGKTLDELTDYWKKEVEIRQDWFLESEKFQSDETKRVGPSKTPNEIFGVEGSFRKLTVD